MIPVKKLLIQASKCLPDDMQVGPEVPEMHNFYEYIEHWEWGLAMETLEEIAINIKPAPPASFWAFLIQSARLMKCHSDMIRYQSYIDEI